MPMSIRMNNDRTMLVIKLPVQEPKLSTSKKTFIVGSTRGVRQSDADHQGRPIYAVASAFFYPEVAESACPEDSDIPIEDGSDRKRKRGRPKRMEVKDEK